MKTQRSERLSAKSIERCPIASARARDASASDDLPKRTHRLGLAGTTAALAVFLIAAACDDASPYGSATGGMGATSASGGAGGAGGTVGNDAGGTSTGGNAGESGGGESGATGGTSGATGGATTQPPFVEAVHANEGANHTTTCSAVSYQSSPPSSGTHYGVWAAYKTYNKPVPWGYLVHAMEHGAIIVVYNCPAGCATEVAAAQAWIAGLPTDPLCSGRPRIILAPDPDLDTRWAAAAWQWTLRGTGAFERTAFQRFFDAHYENPDPSLSAPEPGVCSDGSDFSVEGWCP